jgi:D-xylose transport system permease protein
MATTDRDGSANDHLQGGVAVAGGPEQPEEAVTDVPLTSAPELLAGSLREYTRISLKRVRSGESGALPVILGLLAIVIYFQISQPTFLSAGNVWNLMGQAGWIITLAMAQTFVLLLGEIDLSVGYNAAVGATITFWMLAIHDPFPVWVAILAGLSVTAAISAIEGLIVVWLKIPSFVVTLAGLLALSGLLLWLYEKTGSVGLGGVISAAGFKTTIVNDLVSGDLSYSASWIALIVLVAGSALYMITRNQRRRSHGLVAPPLSVTVLKIAVAAAVGVVLVVVLNRSSGVPWVVLIVLGVLAIATSLLTRTKFGRYVYAVGGNAEAARRAGVSLSRIRVISFAFCGVFAGLAGILYASNLGSISNNFNGGQYVLYSVAGAVIGGVSLFGGRGRMFGAVLGGFVVAVIYNGVALLGLGAAGQYIWTAAVLLAAVVLDALARRGSAPT